MIAIGVRRSDLPPALARFAPALPRLRLVVMLDGQLAPGWISQDEFRAEAARPLRRSLRATGPARPTMPSTPTLRGRAPGQGGQAAALRRHRERVQHRQARMGLGPGDRVPLAPPLFWPTRLQRLPRDPVARRRAGGCSRGLIRRSSGPGRTPPLHGGYILPSITGAVLRHPDFRPERDGRAHRADDRERKRFASPPNTSGRRRSATSTARPRPTGTAL